MKPPVTVILPTFNEREFIRDCLDDLLTQDYENVDEILVVDGGSDDGTRDIVEHIGGRVRLVDNPKRTAAAAMNLGIATARNEIAVRADAHTRYAPDYVRVSVDALLDSSAAVVGGPMRPVGITPFGRAVAAVTSSPFGVGPGRFHYSTTRQHVDTVYLGTFRRSTIIDAGGYDDERLQWAAEDQELNYRIRMRGGTILLDPGIRSQYFPRQAPRGLARQYHNYGVCKASTLAKHRSLPSWRPLAPALMVAGTVLWVVWHIRRRPGVAALPLAAYGALVGAVTTKLSRERGVTPHRVAMALAICHWTYGAGFWRGMWRFARGRSFDTRPTRR
jgi:hypothetical protein